ncbi:MAG TPA: hypothetical protein VHM93_24235 [Candidatus Acidoferrum sp.]|jgi:hypothetical protein|nr:hypothetical protein [Candidatus Acidoferrum sp.]
MAIICVIRDQIDPFQQRRFQEIRGGTAAAAIWSDTFFLTKPQTT